MHFEVTKPRNYDKALNLTNFIWACSLQSNTVVNTGLWHTNQGWQKAGFYLYCPGRRLLLALTSNPLPHSVMPNGIIII